MNIKIHTLIAETDKLSLAIRTSFSSLILTVNNGPISSSSMNEI